MKDGEKPSEGWILNPEYETVNHRAKIVVNEVNGKPYNYDEIQKGGDESMKKFSKRVEHFVQDSVYLASDGRQN